MQQLAEPETLNTDYETPVVCPVCWHSVAYDYAVKRAAIGKRNAVRLGSTTADGCKHEAKAELQN